MKTMNHSLGTIGRWPVTDMCGGASLLPYTPAGVTGSDDDDEEGERWRKGATVC